MTNKLHMLRNAAALEAFSMRDVAGYFKDVMPSLASSFQDFVERFSPRQEALQFTREQRDFNKAMQGQNYMAVAQVTAYVPEGLNVPYLDYAEVLLDAVHHASKVMDVLAPYSMYLAQLITDKETVLSTKSFEAEFKFMEQERNRINEELGACFKKGSTRSEAALSDVVKRNADWESVFQRCAEITDTINRIDRGAVLKKVNECSRHLDVILKMVREDKVSRVANQTVLNLADGAYQVASELEFYAVAYFKAEVFVHCVKETLEHFKKVMKK